jgi:MoaA/NifB/PqqE/SkfB family radical SAM enzyme
MTSPLHQVLLDISKVNPLAYVNAFLGYAAWLFRRPRPYSLPWKIDLVLTKACNLRCAFFISYDSLGGERWMDFGLYEHIARQLFPSAHSIFFCSGGEPLLYPKIREALRLARHYRTFATMVSNGTLLNRETARWMADDQSLHELSISFDGARKETLERIRRGASYETILDNIDFLAALKRKKGLTYPRLSFHYIIMKANAEELPQIFKICSQYGIDKVRVDYLNVTNELEVHESLFYHPELTAQIFTESRRRAKEWGIQVELPPLPGPESRRRRCAYPWQFVLIEPDGSIRFCYHSWRQRLGFFSDDFRFLWRGDHYQKIRRTMDSPNPYYPYCRFCPDRLGFSRESSHNQRINAEAYVIPGLEHLQTPFNQRSEENLRAFTELNAAP